MVPAAPAGEGGRLAVPALYMNDLTRKTLSGMPLRIIFTIALATFGAELVAMAVIEALPDLPKIQRATLDAAILVVLLGPVFYFVLFKPLLAQILRAVRAEEETSRQKEFTENLVRNAAIPVFVLDPDHRVLYWNHACEKLTGLTAEEIIGTDSHWKAFYAVRRPVLADLIVDSATEQISGLYKNYGVSKLLPFGIYGEGWFENVGGQKRYLLFESAPLLDHDGRTVAAIETLLDLSEQKRNEEAILAVSQGISASVGIEFFHLLTKNLIKALNVDYAFVGELDPVSKKSIKTIAVCAKGEIIDNFEYQLSGTPCDVVLTEGLCFYPARVWERFPEDRMLVEMGIESYVGIPLFDSQGHAHGIMVVLKQAPLEHMKLTGSILQIFAMRASAEIERLRADRDLKAKTAQLSSLVEHLQSGIVFVDSAGEIVLSNSKFSEIFGDSGGAASLVGQQYAEIAGKNASLFRDPAAFVKRLNAQMAGNEIVASEELRLADGRILDHDYIPILSEGTAIGHIWRYRDITARKELEHQLLQAQKMEVVGLLAGGVAHDFNNILTAIIGYANILEMKMAHDETLRRYVESIIATAERGAGVTQGLLTFSRKQLVSPKVVDLNSIVRKVEKLLVRLIGEDILLETELVPGEALIMADTGQLEQVLMNLATNARDAMKKGGKLLISTRIEHAGATAGRSVMLTVSDTGEGIEQSNIDKIFTPFFTTKGIGKGTGLGLSIVHGIVEQNSGRIEVFSEPGRGTRIRMTFPEAEQRPELEPAVIRHQANGGSETILLAEDDPEVRKFLIESLELFGYRVIPAADGEEALRAFRAHRDEIRLLITDVIMPKMNGKEVYEAIRAEAPHLRAFFLSGYTAEVMESRGFDRQEVMLLSKPIVIQDLLVKVREVLDR